MIRTFTVKHFKSIESVDDLELGQVNVFMGPNAAGKSNLLEAFGVLAAAANGRVDDEALLRRGVRPGIPALFKAAFPDSTAAEIRFCVSTDDASYDVGLFNPITHPWPAWHFHTEKLTSGNEVLFGRSHHTRKKQHPEAGLAALKLVDLDPKNPAARLLETLRNFSIYSPNTPTLRGLVPDPQTREPVGLAGGGLPSGVVGAMNAKRKDQERVWNEIFEMISWARNIRVMDAAEAPLSPSVPTSPTVLGFVDEYMRKGRNTLTGYDASEGALYVLFTAVLALHEKAPRMFAIDNADHGLNPRLARKLTECFCRWILESSNRRQALLTSHNPLVLDALPLQDDRVRLFIVDRSQQGKSIVNRLIVDENLLAKAKKGWTLSRLWLTGNLGGMPSGI